MTIDPSQICTYQYVGSFARMGLRVPDGREDVYGKIVKPGSRVCHSYLIVEQRIVGIELFDCFEQYAFL